MSQLEHIGEIVKWVVCDLKGHDWLPHSLWGWKCARCGLTMDDCFPSDAIDEATREATYEATSDENS